MGQSSPKPGTPRKRLCIGNSVIFRFSLDTSGENRFHVQTKAFSTDDNVASFRFSPLRGVSHNLAQLRFFPTYTHNLIWEIMQRQAVKVDSNEGSGTWEKRTNHMIYGLFESFVFWRVKKIWWTMTNLMVADIRPTAKESQETTVQVMDDMKFLQQQRNIEIVRFLDIEYIFGGDMWHGWKAPTARDLQMMPQAQIDALPTLEPYKFSWTQGSDDFWLLTHYQGDQKLHVNSALKPGHHIDKIYDCRADWGQEWQGFHSLTVVDTSHPPNYYNLISPVLNQWHTSAPFAQPQQLTCYKFHDNWTQEWDVQLQFLPPNSHPEYYGSPIPEMYWCVNVEGLADEHWIQLQYKLDVGFELEFMQPRQTQPGASRESALLNRMHKYYFNVLGCNFGGSETVGMQLHIPDYKLWTLQAGSPDQAHTIVDSGYIKWPPQGMLASVPTRGYAPPPSSTTSRNVTRTYDDFDEEQFLKDGLTMDM